MVCPGCSLHEQNDAGLLGTHADRWQFPQSLSPDSPDISLPALTVTTQGTGHIWLLHMEKKMEEQNRVKIIRQEQGLRSPPQWGVIYSSWQKEQLVVAAAGQPQWLLTLTPCKAGLSARDGHMCSTEQSYDQHLHTEKSRTKQGSSWVERCKVKSLPVPATVAHQFSWVYFSVGIHNCS